MNAPRKWNVAASADTTPQKYTAYQGDGYNLTYDQAQAVAKAANAYPKLVDRLKCTLVWLETLRTRNRSEDVHYQRIHDLLCELGEAK